MNKPNTLNGQRAVSIVLLGALFVRLYTLGSESFWLDEAIVWDRVRGGPMKFFFDWDADTQGPVYPVLMWIWCKLFGFSEISMRMPSVIFGVLSVHALYLLGKRVFGHAAAMWASVFAAVNPFLLYYSQEARPYTLWLWSSLLAVWFLTRLMEQHSKRNEVGWISFTLISLYTHPYGPFLLAVFVIMVLMLQPKDDWKRFFKPALIIGIAYLPEAFIFLDTFIGKVENKWSVAAWINRPGLMTPWVYMKYYFSWYILAALASALLVGGVLFYRDRLKNFRLGFGICIAIATGTFVLPWLVSQVTPILWMRYTITVVAPILLVIGWVIAQTKKPLQIVAVGLFSLGTTVPLYHYYLETDKDPWRQAVEWLTPQVSVGDKFIVHPLRAPKPFEYYFHDLYQHQVAVPFDTTEFAESLPDSGTVWFVAATYSQSKPMRDASYALLNRSCDCDSTYKTADLYFKNPYRIFSADVEITRCVVRQYSAPWTPH
ncbi:MAG: glycosyltransferase family 39 protein [bacterium]|nr:glycosyltransferase family 39 protein [bacterium]